VWVTERDLPLRVGMKDIWASETAATLEVEQARKSTGKRVV